MSKHNHANGPVLTAERAGSEPVDAPALSKALKDYEEAGRVREVTPGASPSRKRQRIYGDRSVDITRQRIESEFIFRHARNPVTWTIWQ